MDRVLFALGNGDLDRVVIGRRSDAGLLHPRPERAKHGVGLVERRAHLGRHREVFFVKMTQDADPQSPDIAGQRGAVIGDRAIGARRVLGVVPGQRLQHDRAILDRPGHRAGMVKSEGIGINAGPADEAVGRLQSDDAAQRRRTADRPAGVGPHRAGHKSRGDRRAGTARRAAGEMLAVPRVARWRPGEVERRAAMRELVGCQLADEDPAGLIQPGDRCRVLGRNIIGANPRVAGGADAGGAIDVLQPERDTVQRAAIIARHDLALGGARLRPRLVGRRQQKSVDLRVERLDSRQERVGQLHR